jgi:Na+-transporting methylmalonyl-CoA/oxaloacetate decarboxylase gamma subunit
MGAVFSVLIILACVYFSRRAPRSRERKRFTLIEGGKR